MVYLEWVRCNSVIKCVLQPKIAKKIHKKTYFGSSKWFKVMDVGNTGKVVSSAWHDKQQVCV